MNELEDEMGRRKDEEESDLPDPKAPISTRLKGTILTKLDAIAAVRRARAEEQGRPANVVKAIDRHFVLNLVLPSALDAELKALGVDVADENRLYELAASPDLKKKTRVSKDIDARQIAADGVGRKHAAGH